MLIGTAKFPCNSDRYQKPRQCEGDMMFRVRHAEGGSVYFYLMLEFQSQPDHWMAVRVGAYVFLLYQHLIKEKQITPETGLPPVWKAAKTMNRPWCFGYWINACPIPKKHPYAALS